MSIALVVDAACDLQKTMLTEHGLVLRNSTTSALRKWLADRNK